MKNKVIFPAVLLILISLFFVSLDKTGIAEGNSDTWRKLLEVRSSSIFTESLDLGGLRVGGRGRIIFTWLDRSLLRTLERNRDTGEDVINGLGYYYGSKSETAALIRNRDVFLLTYQAFKRWDFKIEEIVINGYRLTTDDILTPPYYRVLGEIEPLRMRARYAEDEEDLDDFRLHVAVPSMPRSGKVILSYGEDIVEWEIPRR